MSEPAEGVRVDVWLWRARFFKTRTLACKAVEDGRVRLTRSGSQAPIRLDKGSRTVRPGDALVFATAGRVHALTVCAVGDRRGPADEARALYSLMENGTGGEPSH